MEQSAKVLVVDDYEPNAKGMRDLLVAAGHTVRVAFNGVDALQVASVLGRRFELKSIATLLGRRIAIWAQQRDDRAVNGGASGPRKRVRKHGPYLVVREAVIVRLRCRQLGYEPVFDGRSKNPGDLVSFYVSGAPGGCRMKPETRCRLRRSSAADLS